MRTDLGIMLLAMSTWASVSIAQGQNQAVPANPSAPSATNPAPQQSYDPLLDLPPLPHNQVTLMGGVVISMDEVMNRMVFQPFGTRDKLHINFDTRTHFYQDGKPITEREIKPGERVYLDTMLNHDKVFARTIWMRTASESGLGRGQIIDFDGRRKVLTLRDELSSRPLRLQLTPATVVRKGVQPGAESDLVEGALVNIEFGPQHELRAITVLATPGSTFTFAGRVTYVDLSQKLIAIDNRSDGKKYDVFMDAISAAVFHQVHEGNDVSVSAVFDGERYSARNIDIGVGSAENR
jgi:hypothetical protein